METSLQLRPLSRVTCTRPVVVPTQMVPGATVEGEIDSMEPLATGAGMGAAAALPPPAADTAATGTVVRSGPSWRQWMPPSVVAMRYWKPARSSRGFQGAQASGCDCEVRSLSEGSCAGLTLIHCSSG